MRLSLLAYIFSVIVSLGKASIVIGNNKRDLADVLDDSPWEVALSPKVLLQRALLEHILGRQPISVSKSNNLRLRQQQQRLLEDDNNDNNNDNNNENNNENEKDNNNNNDNEIDNNENDNNNDNVEEQENNDVDGVNNDEGEAANEEEGPTDASSSCAFCDHFNNMSHSGKIWTLVLLCWGFVLLLATCILMVRACTTQKRNASNRKQLLIPSSMTMDDPKTSSRGRTRTRRGWFGRVLSRPRSRPRK
jgi:hypothetical protein